MSYHKKRKKGARSFFYRYKKRADSSSQEKDSPQNINLPAHWQLVVATNNDVSCQYCKVGVDGISGLCMVTASVTVSSDSTWNAYFNGKRIPVTCNILSKYPPKITSQGMLSEVIAELDRAVLCPGNPDNAFVDIYKKKDGMVKGNRGSGETVAFVDSTPVISSCGKQYLETIRRVDCDIISNENSDHYPLPCGNCKSFRSTLRSALSRQSCTREQSTSASSHTKYGALTSEEKNSRLRNLHQSLKLSKQHIRHLESKIATMIEDESIHLQEEDEADLSSIIQDVDKVVKEGFKVDSPQRIFWDQQAKHNSLKNKCQMRWHPLVIRFALNLKYLSTSAYKAM